jgi:hypothetical protein
VHIKNDGIVIHLAGRSIFLTYEKLQCIVPILTAIRNAKVNDGAVEEMWITKEDHPFTGTIFLPLENSKTSNEIYIDTYIVFVPVRYQHMLHLGRGLSILRSDVMKLDAAAFMEAV